MPFSYFILSIKIQKVNTWVLGERKTLPTEQDRRKKWHLDICAFWFYWISEVKHSQFLQINNQTIGSMKYNLQLRQHPFFPRKIAFKTKFSESLPSNSKNRTQISNGQITLLLIKWCDGLIINRIFNLNYQMKSSNEPTTCLHNDKLHLTRLPAFIHKKA